MALRGFDLDETDSTAWNRYTLAYFSQNLGGFVLPGEGERFGGTCFSEAGVFPKTLTGWLNGQIVGLVTLHAIHLHGVVAM